MRTAAVDVDDDATTSASDAVSTAHGKTKPQRKAETEVNINAYRIEHPLETEQQWQRKAEQYRTIPNALDGGEPRTRSKWSSEIVHVRNAEGLLECRIAAHGIARCTLERYPMVSFQHQSDRRECPSSVVLVAGEIWNGC